MKKITVKTDRYGNIRPNEIKGWYFPNWFEKEHFEGFMGKKKLTDKQFEALKIYLSNETNMHDDISATVREYLNDKELQADIRRILREAK